MPALLLTLATIISTFIGGWFALRNSTRLHKVLGFTAGVLIGLVAFDLLPEIFAILQSQGINPTIAMSALVFGFLVFHILEKTILLHTAHESEYGKHHHPNVGVASALALIGHSFLDGVGIGLGFQISAGVGIAVGIAVIAHDFADGINTVSLLLAHKNTKRRAWRFLAFDAIAPVLGVLSTFLFHPSQTILVIYLSFFAGFLLYIGSSEILPEAHSKRSSYGTILLTISGVLFMFIVTRFH